MSQEIKLKRSDISGKIPAIGQLTLGEIAINTNDGRMYIKKEVSSGAESVILINTPEIAGRLWDVGIVYKQGDIVSHNNNGNLYVAIVDNQGSDPAAGTVWYEFNTPRHNEGFWTPTAGDEYPNIIGVEPGAVWYINGLPDYVTPPGPQGGYDMLTGALAGIHVSNNDKFVWYGYATDKTEIWLFEQAPDFVEEKGGVAFNSATFYQIGDTVTYGGIQYQALAGIPAGPWDVTLWDPIYSEKGGIAWDPLIQYEPGDIISYNGGVYVTPIPAPPPGTSPGMPGWPLISLERGGIMWTLGQSYKIGDNVWDNAARPAAIYTCIVDHVATMGDSANGSPQQVSALNWTAQINDDPGAF